jgi:tetratricopeptide (TPR) repeat protein
LDAYRAARTAFLDELGIEPSATLRKLHRAMLRGEPLEEPASAVRPGRPAPAAPPSRTPAPAHSVPNLLPAAVPDFTGRSALIEQVLADTATASRLGLALPVTVLFGQGGAGKTTTAVHLAHRMAASFPDGQLFAQLRSGVRAADPFDILGRFLRAMGISGPALPQDVEERAEVYRNLLAKRRMLIVLDDAQTDEQVSLLLPGSARCSVIVTSRRHLAGLAATNRAEVGTFSERSAVGLLASILGAERVAAEPEAVTRLCRLCGCLPLALRIAGARLTARPHWPVSALVDRLADESARLNELKYGNLAMRASIMMSYQALGPEAQRLFRLLGASEAPNFAAWVAAPLLQADPLHAEDLVEELTEAYLLSTEPVPAGEPTRYRFHDIVRPFALELLVEMESTAERRAALERLLGGLLYLTDEAHRREYSGDYGFPASNASRWRLPGSFTDRILESPLSWFEQERLTLVAGVRQAATAGFVGHCWGLALNAVTLFESHSDYADWRTTHETALKVACRHGDSRGEAVMRYSLGSLYLFQRVTALASRQFEQASMLFNRLGDEHGAAMVLRHMAFLDRQSGNLDQALSRWEQAIGTFQVVGDRIAEAHTLHNMAQIHLDRGEDDHAHALLTRAERICRETGNRRVGTQVRHRLGGLYFQRGELSRSAEMYEYVLEAVRACGDRVGECHALLGLAAVSVACGEPRSAEATVGDALELAETIGDPILIHRVLLALAEAGLARGDLKNAAVHAETATREFGLLGAIQLQVRALTVQGRVQLACGHPDEARRTWQTARDLLSGRQLWNAVTLRADLERMLAGLPG